MYGEEQEQRSEGSDGRHRETAGVGNESLLESREAGGEDAEDGLAGSGEVTLRQEHEELLAQSHREAGSTQRGSTGDGQIEGKSLAEHEGPQAQPGAAGEGQHQGTRSEGPAECGKDGPAGGSENGSEKVQQPGNSNTTPAQAEQEATKEAGKENDGEEEGPVAGGEERGGQERAGPETQGKPTSAGSPSGLALSLPLDNLPSVAQEAHGGRQELGGDYHETRDERRLATGKPPERLVRTFDAKPQEATGRRDPIQERAGSNTMLADSVSTNNSPYYIQALENGPVLQGMPAGAAAKRRAIARERRGSVGASTATGSARPKDEAPPNSGQATAASYPRPTSLEAQIGIQPLKVQGNFGQAIRPPRMANVYGERAAPRRLSNDLWNKVQMRRAKAKAAAGTGPVKSLNLEARGLLALNKKEQHRFDTLGHVRQRAAHMAKPALWNLQVQGYSRQGENLSAARAADPGWRGRPKRGAATEAKIGENTPTMNKTQTVSSGSHTFGNANSGAIGTLDKDVKTKSLMPAFGPVPLAQRQPPEQTMKALEQTAKQPSLHDSTENESPGPAIREPRSYPEPVGQNLGSTDTHMLKLRDQLRGTEVLRQPAPPMDLERDKRAAQPGFNNQKPTFASVHDRLSQNKERCALQCRYLQEERVPRSAASPELSQKARGSTRPQRSEYPEAVGWPAEYRYKRAPAGGRSRQGRNTFSRTYLHDYMETAGSQRTHEELFDWATPGPGDEQLRRGVGVQGVRQRRTGPQLRSRASTKSPATISRASRGQSQRADDHYAGARGLVDSSDGQDPSLMATKSGERWRDIIRSCTQAGEQAARRQAINSLDRARDVSILKESYRRVYPLNLNQNIEGQAALFKPIAAAREPVKKFLRNRHANAHLEPAVVSTSPSRLSQGQTEQHSGANTFFRRGSQTQATEEKDQEEDEHMAESVGALAARTAEDFAERRKYLRTVDAAVQRPAYNTRQLSSEGRSVLQDESGFRMASLPDQLIGLEAHRLQVAPPGVAGSKPRTRQEGKRPRNRKYGSLDSNTQAVDDWPSTIVAGSHAGAAHDERIASIDRANNATSQLSTLTSAADAASKNGQATAALRAKSQILQSQIYNRTMISNLNNITSRFLQEQIAEEIILNEYGKYLQEQPYAAQDEAKQFVLQPRVYDKVVESQLPFSGKWFPEQSDAIKVGQRGAIKDITTHYSSMDPKTMIREQMALNSKRKEFQQFKAQILARQAEAEGSSPVMAADRANWEAVRQLRTLTSGPASPSRAGTSGFSLPLSALCGTSSAARPGKSIIWPPVGSAWSVKPPDAVDTLTKCEYERRPGDDKREYQPVQQRVGERAKVKLYIRSDLKKVQDPKEKYHRHIRRQLQDNTFRKKIKLHDFVKPESVDFGITTTLLEPEQVIPNQNLHLDFYPQRRPRDRHRRAQQAQQAKSPGKGLDFELAAGADNQQKRTDADVSQRIEKIMASYRAEQRELLEGKMWPSIGEQKWARQAAASQRENEAAEARESRATQQPPVASSPSEPPTSKAEDLAAGGRSPRLQSLLESLVILSHQQAKTTADKLAKEKQDERDFNNLYYYQQYLAQNELGRDIFRTQQKEFNELLERFQHQDDWFREVLNVRKHQLLHPEKDVDGDGVADEEQEVLPIRGGGAGQLLNGVFYTREQLEEKIEQRRVAYFDLFSLAQRINKGLKGDLTQHGTRERLAKLKAIDDLHTMMSVKEMLNLIKPVPQRQPFE